MGRDGGTAFGAAWPRKKRCQESAPRKDWNVEAGQSRELWWVQDWLADRVSIRLGLLEKVVLQPFR
jgi:hypothetical protein